MNQQNNYCVLLFVGNSSNILENITLEYVLYIMPDIDFEQNLAIEYTDTINWYH